MASTTFKVVSWSPLDPITKDKLDAMVNNDNYLKDKMVTGRDGRAGKTNGIKILTGMMNVPAGPTADFDKVVNMGTYFSQGCMPIITATPYSPNHRKVFLTIDGPGAARYPSSSAFALHVRVEGVNGKKVTRKAMDIVWTAVGY